MLSKDQRMKKEKDFERVVRAGETVKEGFLILKWAKNNSQLTKIGISVPLKSVKNAVERNKIKRRLSNLLRKEEKSIKRGQNLLFITLPGVGKQSFQLLGEAVRKILSKAKLLV